MTLKVVCICNSIKLRSIVLAKMLIAKLKINFFKKKIVELNVDFMPCNFSHSIHGLFLVGSVYLLT